MTIWTFYVIISFRFRLWQKLFSTSFSDVVLETRISDVPYNTQVLPNVSSHLSYVTKAENLEENVGKDVLVKFVDYLCYSKYFIDSQSNFFYYWYVGSSHIFAITVFFLYRVLIKKISFDKIKCSKMVFLT